tara:strand:- start:1070 stop:1486 length:417 start_codon:yes stop_codon:yes gene_type:complete
MKKKFKAMVLSCMDPRFQPIVFNYLKKKQLIGKYSAFTIAGGALGVTNKKFQKWHSVFFDNLKTSINLHNIQKLIIINHFDCGVAKIINKKKVFDKKVEIEIHKEAFKIIKNKIKKKFPKLKIELNLISLKKEITKFN